MLEALACCQVHKRSTCKVITNGLLNKRAALHAMQLATYTFISIAHDSLDEMHSCDQQQVLSTWSGLADSQLMCLSLTFTCCHVSSQPLHQCLCSGSLVWIHLGAGDKQLANNSRALCRQHQGLGMRTGANLHASSSSRTGQNCIRTQDA